MTAAIPAKIKIEHQPTASLVPYARNAKRHSPEQITGIAASIREFGFTNPVLIDKANGIIAGHGRVLAAQQLSLATVPCIRLGHLTDAQRRAYILADNRLAEQGGGWDTDMLKLELSEIEWTAMPDLDLGTFDFPAIEGMDDPPPPAGENDAPPEIDRAEELNKKWQVKPGDVWQIGDHRLMCGDSRCEDVDVLIDKPINLAFTSPPYASQRDYDETSGFKPVPPDEYVGWFAPVSAMVQKHLATDGSFFINIKPSADGLDTHLYVFDLVIAHVREWGWHFATEFCWERNGVPKSVTRRFKNQFEPVYQFAIGDWKMAPDRVRHESQNVPMSLGKGSGNTAWDARQGNGGVIPKNRRPRKNGSSITASATQGQNTCPGEAIGSGLAFPGNRLPTFTATHEALGHSAAFPVGLPAFFITAYSDAGDTVYDPFLGSGTTMVAAQNLARKCYGMEISPNYCAVILERMATAFPGIEIKRLP